MIFVPLKRNVIMEALIEFLLAWIGKNSEYDTAALPLPVVIELTAEQITREAYSDQPDLIPVSGIDHRILALYSWEDNETGTVFILRAADTEGIQSGEEPLENPVFQERLLHELVHHVQYWTGAYDTFQCKSYGEKQAYELGSLFLKQRHEQDPLPERNFLLRIYSRC